MDKSKSQPAVKSISEEPVPDHATLDMVRKEIAKAKSLFKYNQLDRALLVLGRCLMLAPTFDEVYLARAEVYRQDGQLEQALVNLDQAIKLNPKNASAYIQRGEIFRLLKRFQEALKDLDRAIQINPANSLALGRRGTIYRATHEFAKSLADYNQAIALDPTGTWLYGNRAETYRNLQEYRKALNDYNEVLRRDPKLTWVYERRSYVQLWLGYLKNAQADFEQAWRENPANLMNGWLAQWVGMCQKSFTLNFEIQEKLKALADYNPRHFAAYLCRGCLLWLLEGYKKSYFEAQAACELTGDRPEALFWKGMAAAGMGQNEEAFDLIQKAEEGGLHPVLLGPLRWQKTINPEFYQKYSHIFTDKDPVEYPLARRDTRLAAEPEKPGPAAPKPLAVAPEETRPDRRPQSEFLARPAPVENKTVPAVETRPDPPTRPALPRKDADLPGQVTDLNRPKFERDDDDEDSGEKTQRMSRPELEKIKAFPEKPRQETTLPNFTPVKAAPKNTQDTTSLRLMPLRTGKESPTPSEAVTPATGNFEPEETLKSKAAFPVEAGPVKPPISLPELVRPLKPSDPGPIEPELVPKQPAPFKEAETAQTVLNEPEKSIPAAPVVELPVQPPPVKPEITVQTRPQPPYEVQSPVLNPATPPDPVKFESEDSTQRPFKLKELVATLPPYPAQFNHSRKQQETVLEAVPPPEPAHFDRPPAPPMAPEPTLPKTSRKWWVLSLLIILPVVVVLAVGIFVYLLLLNGNDTRITITVASTAIALPSPAATTLPATALPATSQVTTDVQNPATALPTTAAQPATSPALATATIAPTTVVAITPSPVAPSTAASSSPVTGPVSLLSSQAVEGHAGPVTSASWTRDGRYFATGSDDKTIKVWEAATGKPVITLATKTDGGAPVAVAWSSDGKNIVSGWSDRNVRAFRVFADNKPNSGPAGQMLAEVNDGVLPEAVAISADNTFVTFPGLDVLNVLNISKNTREPGYTLGTPSQVLAVNFSPNNKYMAAGLGNGRVIVWDITTYKLILVILPDQNKGSNPVRTVNWTPDGKMLVVGSQKTLAVYQLSLSGGAKVLDVPIALDVKSPVAAVSLSVNGKLFAAGFRQGFLEVWSIEQKKMLGQVVVGSDALLSVSFNDDNRQVFGLTGGTQPRRLTFANQEP